MAQNKKEPRYIDANLVKEALIGWETDPTDDEIEYVIDNIPTADVASKREIANEIFEDVRNSIFSLIFGEAFFDDVCGALADLRKKYKVED